MTCCSTCTIIENQCLGDGFFALRLDAPSVAQGCLPGQFILLRGLVPTWPYLRRPFSLYSSDGESIIEIVYKVVGRATSAMSHMSDGDRFDVVGPLGRGFTAGGGLRRVVAVAGGIGVPPLAFYCKKYVGVHEETTLVVGARTRNDLLVPVGLVVDGVKIMTYTEDGSKGTRGTALDGLREVIRRSEVEPEAIRVISCGPRDMLALVAGLCQEAGVFCEVGIEEMMACGVGACLSCAVPAAGGGYLHACKDGPVLESSSVDWERWLSL